MRWLPCPRCRAGATGGPDREPLLVSSISPTGYRYKCSTCKHTTKLTHAQFLALPAISPADLADPKGRFRSWPSFQDMVRSHYLD